ncbi:hypothetical protein Catovirus_1_7 [Catovirus CTV1]|uniref:Uncharacterized protein n=1 Tax=Catovirus CTV1 TaxID=1977631 RepID=A0A1V0S8C5_9VIRU|nr:hypothetical protein Catovirus_1_7 [Catovirus CTV1]
MSDNSNDYYFVLVDIFIKKMSIYVFLLVKMLLPTHLSIIDISFCAILTKCFTIALIIILHPLIVLEYMLFYFG